MDYIVIWTIWLYGLYGYMDNMVIWTIWLYGLYGYTDYMVIWTIWLYGQYGYTDYILNLGFLYEILVVMLNKNNVNVSNS